MARTNTRLVLAKRPERGPVTNETFRLESVELEPIKDGEVLVKVEYSAIVSLLVYLYDHILDRSLTRDVLGWFVTDWTDCTAGSDHANLAERCKELYRAR